MILRKPYAFFIKIFKPMHLLLSGGVLYLILITSNILKFLNGYIYSVDVVAGEKLINPLIDNFLYIIPAIAILIFMFLLSIMYKKNKPILFYFVGIFSFLVVLVINIYSVNFLNILIENVVSVKSVKLIHDLILINVIIESVMMVLLFIRGTGIDFKKFDFGSDITKLEISEKDKEEFEIKIEVDFNEKKRKRKEKIRKLKYLYLENKLVINVVIILIVLCLTFFTVYFIKKANEVNKEGIYYDFNSFTFKVNDTKILNTDYQGHKITDNYLVLVDVSIKTNQVNKSLYLNDFSLKIENIKFKPVKKYFDSLVDLGHFYDEEVLSFEYTDYIFAYEISEKYINSEMLFSYTSEGNVIDVLLEPKELVSTELFEEKKIGEDLVFEGVLAGIDFKINNYEINNKFLIEYDYCIKDNDCILSKEYIKASIDENYDKVVMKLNVDYNSESDLKINDFYELLSKFGVISYKKGDVWTNIYKFEEIISKKTKQKNDIYIGVNSNILNAEEIKIVFDVRGLRYEYILKQVSE